MSEHPRTDTYTGFELTPLERLHLMRTLGDLHQLAASYGTGGRLSAASRDASFAWLEAVYYPQRTALDRLRGDGAFLTPLAHRLGEPGLRAALGQASVRNDQLVASFEALPGPGQPLMPFIEVKLQQLDEGAGTALDRLAVDLEALRLGEDVVAMDFGNTLGCAAGVALTTGGAVATAGGIVTGDVPMTAIGAIALGAGLALADHYCHHG